ncbi:MAG: ectoine/hydroxyectoine ABC transporter permease subunit EhuC [Pseudonocardia sp.]|nr:ectoine/hydroxyectoine ABC transporter permease subunit EhuC [Pseudonocardia sp.]
MFDNLGLIVSRIAEGLSTTVVATVGGIALTVVFAVAAGLGMLSRSAVVRGISRTYVEFFRGTSEVVQLFWIFFALPALTGFQILPLAAAILVLALNHGAYGGEIVRGAVQSVPRAQYEGALALSLAPRDRMLRVILPQALVEMLPPFNNLFIQLLKSTSLLSLVVVTEITYVANSLRAVLPVAEQLTIYAVLLLMYLVLSLLITAGVRWLERRAAARLGRTGARRRAVTVGAA